MTARPTTRPPHDRHQRAVWRAYGAAIERLRAALDEPAVTDSVAEHHTVLAIEALRGMGPAAWIMFDERDGYRDAEPWRFAIVRRARNSATWGPRLLAAVNERLPGRAHA
jgi:hypothetical protein